MSFGFSATDCLRAIELIVSVIDGIRDAGKAASGIEGIAKELEALKASLQSVHDAKLGAHLSTEATALHQAATQCQATIEEFWNKICRYQRHLQATGLTARLKSSWTRIKWATIDKDDVALFRAEIRGHTSSLTILLMTVQLKAFSLESDTGEKRRKDLLAMLASLTSRVDGDSSRQLAFHADTQTENQRLRQLLEMIASEIADMKKEAASERLAQKTFGDTSTVVCGQVFGALRTVTDSVSSSTSQGRVLLEASLAVVRSNFSIFAAIERLHTSILLLPRHLQPVQQEPVYFTDPFNRLRPFHLELMVTEGHLLSILRQDFEDRECDTGLLTYGNFTIDETATGRSIDWSAPWDTRFDPGQRVAMSMVFKRQDAGGTTCPRCQTEQSMVEDGEILCSTCGTIFRRIEELEEDRKQLAQVPAPRKRRFADAESNSEAIKRRCVVPRTQHPTVAPADEHATMSKFRRLRIIERKTITLQDRRDGSPDVNDKHKSAPQIYQCRFKPCTYSSKRKSNCKKHMQKAHGWSKKTGKFELQDFLGMALPTPFTASPESNFMLSPDMPNNDNFTFSNLNYTPGPSSSEDLFDFNTSFRREPVNTADTVMSFSSGSHFYSARQLPSAFELALPPEDLTFNQPLFGLDGSINNYTIPIMQPPLFQGFDQTFDYSSGPTDTLVPPDIDTTVPYMPEPLPAAPYSTPTNPTAVTPSATYVPTSGGSTLFNKQVEDYINSFFESLTAAGQEMSSHGSLLKT